RRALSCVGAVLRDAARHVTGRDERSVEGIDDRDVARKLCGGVDELGRRLARYVEPPTAKALVEQPHARDISQESVRAVDTVLVREAGVPCCGRAAGRVQLESDETPRAAGDERELIVRGGDRR